MASTTHRQVVVRTQETVPESSSKSATASATRALLTLSESKRMDKTLKRSKRKSERERKDRALQKLGVVSRAEARARRKKERVLDEDTYVSVMESIISRDYFSGHQSVSKQSIGALKGGTSLSDSEVDNLSAIGKCSIGHGYANGMRITAKDCAAMSRMTLDQFTSTHTSEDNRSFARQIAKDNEQFLDERKALLLDNPSTDCHSDNDDDTSKRGGRRKRKIKHGELEFWPHSAVNPLLFPINEHNSGKIEAMAERRMLTVTHFSSAKIKSGKAAVVPSNSRFPDEFQLAVAGLQSKRTATTVSRTADGVPMVGGYPLVTAKTPGFKVLQPSKREMARDSLLAATKRGAKAKVTHSAATALQTPLLSALLESKRMRSTAKSRGRLLRTGVFGTASQLSTARRFALATPRLTQQTLATHTKDMDSVWRRGEDASFGALKRKRSVSPVLSVRKRRKNN